MQFQLITNTNEFLDITGVLVDSMVTTRAVNADYNLDFTIIPTANNERVYQLIDVDSVIIYDDQRYTVRICPDNAHSKAVTAIHEFYDLNDDYVQGEIDEGLYNVEQLLNFALSNSTDWTLQYEGTDIPNVTIDKFGDNNPVALIQQIVELANCEFEPDSDGKILRVRKRFGIQRPFDIEYKRNLVTIEKSIDISNVKTAARVYFNRRPSGEYQSSFIYESPNASSFRRLKYDKPIYLDNFNSEALARQYLDQTFNYIPSVSITTTFADLQNAGFRANDIQLGDSVNLVDQRINEFGSVRVVQLQKYPLLPSRSPELVIANRPQNIVNSIVREQANRENLDAIVVKQTETYNGVKVNTNGLTVFSRTNLVTITINADDGFRIVRGSQRVFDVDTNGALQMDGNLLVTNGDGVTPLLQAFRDVRGGVINLYDINGNLNVRLGSEQSFSNTRGGSLQLFADSSSVIPRVIIDARQNLDQEGGRVSLFNSDGNKFIVLDTTSNTESLIISNGINQTILNAFEGYINGQEIATQDWVTANFRPI